MAKTHHRRRHRRANRTRRGGVKSNTASPRAASASAAPVVFPSAPLAPAAPRVATHADLADIFKKIDKIRASHVSASKPKKTISKKEADKKRLSGILSGKVKHSYKSAFKGSVISDSQAARERGY